MSDQTSRRAFLNNLKKTGAVAVAQPALAGRASADPSNIEEAKHQAIENLKDLGVEPAQRSFELSFEKYEVDGQTRFGVALDHQSVTDGEEDLFVLWSKGLYDEFTIDHEKALRMTNNAISDPFEALKQDQGVETDIRMDLHNPADTSFVGHQLLWDGEPNEDWMNPQRGGREYHESGVVADPVPRAVETEDQAYIVQMKDDGTLAIAKEGEVERFEDLDGTFEYEGEEIEVLERNPAGDYAPDAVLLATAKAEEEPLVKDRQRKGVPAGYLKVDNHGKKLFAYGSNVMSAEVTELGEDNQGEFVDLEFEIMHDGEFVFHEADQRVRSNDYRQENSPIYFTDEVGVTGHTEETEGFGTAELNHQVFYI